MSSHRVWKWADVPIADVVRISAPKPFEVVHVALGAEPHTLTVWAILDPARSPRDHALYVVGTGHPIPADAGRHVGTVIDGEFVWHVFERVQS